MRAEFTRDSGGLSTGVLIWGVKPAKRPWLVIYISFATEFRRGRAVRCSIPVRLDLGMN